MDPDANPFTPLASATPQPSEGEPSRTAASIAAEAAASAVRGTTPPGSTFEPTPTYGDPSQPLLSDEAQHMVPGTTIPADGPAAPPAEPVTPVVPADPPAEGFIPPTPTVTAEDFTRLQDMGIYLPVAPENVPAEFQSSYAEMVQAVEDMHHSSQEKVQAAAEQVSKVDAFTERLTTPEGRERMLLTMALNSPETYEKATEIVTRMKEDPEYNESVRRGLEAEVKLEAAIRKERAVESAALARKGQQIESRTVRLAQRLGVNEDVARNMVAHKIMQNGAANGGKNDITFQEVDQIIQNLAATMGSRVPTPVQHPTTQALAQQVPPTPNQAPGQTPVAPGKTHADRVIAHHIPDPLDRLRNAVKASAASVAGSGL